MTNLLIVCNSLRRLFFLVPCMAFWCVVFIGMYDYEFLIAIVRAIDNERVNFIPHGLLFITVISIVYLVIEYAIELAANGRKPYPAPKH